MDNFFNKKYVVHNENLQLYVRLELKLKKFILKQNLINHKRKKNVEFRTLKKNKSKKNGDKDEKVWYQLMSCAIHG